MTMDDKEFYEPILPGMKVMLNPELDDSTYARSVNARKRMPAFVIKHDHGDNTIKDWHKHGTAIKNITPLIRFEDGEEATIAVKHLLVIDGVTVDVEKWYTDTGTKFVYADDLDTKDDMLINKKFGVTNFDKMYGEKWRKDMLEEIERRRN